MMTLVGAVQLSQTPAYNLLNLVENHFNQNNSLTKIFDKHINYLIIYLCYYNKLISYLCTAKLERYTIIRF